MTDGYKIKRILTWQVGVRLPSAYQEVEWIGRNGNNYIDTLRVPKITTNFEVKVGFKFGTSGVRYAIIGNHYQGQNGQLSFEVNAGGVSNNSARYWGKGGTVEDFYSSNSLTLDAFNDLIFKSNGSSTQTIVVNGTTTTGNLGLSTFYNASAYLFIDRELRWSTFSYNSFISYCQIYENGVLVKDFIPCYRKSDNVIGFWESVNRKFYTNKGTGTFTKGNDVPDMVEKQIYPASRLPSSYQEVEYIESTGTQHIDTLYNPIYGTEIYCKFSNSNTSAVAAVFGRRDNNGYYEYSLRNQGTSASAIRYNIMSANGISVTTAAQNTIVEFEYTKNSYKYGQTTGTISPSTSNITGLNLIIFGLMGGGTVDSRKLSGKMRYFKISENGVPVRDFVPCYRKADGVVGMYDVVNSQFYTNAGTGTFTKGPNV